MDVSTLTALVQKLSWHSSLHFSWQTLCICTLAHTHTQTCNYLFLCLLNTMSSLFCPKCVSSIKKKKKERTNSSLFIWNSYKQRVVTVVCATRTDRPVTRRAPPSPASIRMECSGGWAVRLEKACLTDSACIYFKVNTVLFFQFSNGKINKTTDLWN